MKSNGARRSATIKMVAERARVGVASVSRVLSNHPDVSESMRDAVLKAAAEVGYEVDLVARALRSGRSHTIGILVGDLLNPFLAEIAAGTTERLHADGYAVILATSSGDSKQDVESIRTLLQRRVDGLILSPTDETDPELHQLLEGTSAPVMLLDREVGLDNLSGVRTNHREGMEAAVSHLAELGHHRIGLVLGRTGARPSRERRAGFVDAMATRGIDADQSLILSGVHSEDFGRFAADKILRHEEPPTALIAGGNQLTGGVLQAVEGLGLDIPGELSLIGCDDVSLTRLFRPHITVLARDARAMGEAAASGLIARLDAGHGPTTVTLGTRLIVRESTGLSARPLTSGFHR